MRHLGWLSVVLLALSCSVDNSNLNVDAGGTGGVASGSGGAGGAGGCPRCAPTGGTGGSATGTGGAGAAASGGSPGTGGSATGTGGATGGQTGAGGGVAGAGGSGTGGSVTGTGGSVTGTGGKATGGATGSGGKGSGGTTGTGGQGGAADCTKLSTDYSSALTQAKACTPGAAGQCQQLVDSSLSCPGCNTYVNDTTMLDAIDAQWTAAGCDKMHFICPAIACVAPGSPTCQASSPSATTGSCSSIATPLGAH